MKAPIGQTTDRAPTRRRSRLPLYVAMFCVFVIAYASLQPFTGWITPEGSSFSFLGLFARSGGRADIWFNVLAYVPLGIAIAALWPVSWGFAPRLLLSVLCAVALSITVEALQSWLPTRVASTYDLLANAFGAAFGAAIGLRVLQSNAFVNALHRIRDTLFISGAAGDLKILLLLVWLIAQVNPGIALFASTFHPGLDGAFEPAVIAVELTQTAAALIGIGLFTDLAMRKRWLGGLALVIVVASAIALKLSAAQWFLKPMAWEIWLRPGHSLGVAIGAVALTMLFWLPRRAKSIIAGIALLSGVLASVVLPDIFATKAPLSLFNWSYGHLLNLNGLTHTIMLLWPFVATLALLAHFGKQDKDKRRDSESTPDT
jgi:VanZ family protein